MLMSRPDRGPESSATLYVIRLLARAPRKDQARWLRPGQPGTLSTTFRSRRWPSGWPSSRTRPGLSGERWQPDNYGMGMLLGLEARGGNIGAEPVECSLWFAHSDSKAFQDFCADLDPSMTSFETDHSILTGLERALNVSLQPLREIAEHEMEYDDFAAMSDEMGLAEDQSETEQMWHEHTLRQQARWQAVETLADAVNGVLRGIDAEPGLLEHLTETDATDDWHLGHRRYYTDGGLALDLRDLQKMVAWANQQGADAVRMYVE
jgi:hypothetical protein